MNHRRELPVLLAVWAALLALFGLLSPHFFSQASLSSLANRLPALAMVCSGMTLVMVTGGIDLSVGSLLGLCGVIAGGLMTQAGWSLLPALVVAVLVGAAAAGLTGLLAARFDLPSFIVSLGMLEVARGAAFWLSDSRTQYIGGAIEVLARPLAGLGLSPALLLAAAAVVFSHGLLRQHRLGRQWVAVGANAQAAKLSGLELNRPRILAHALLGGLTGLAAVVNASRLGSADPNAGVGFELSVIAAVVVGGTSLSGGRGHVLQSLLGVLIIATVEAGLAQQGVSEPSKRVITGLVIVLAVLAQRWRRPYSSP